jgi:hypothetical protein
LIMRVRVHRNGIVIVTPPFDIAISVVHGAGEAGNGTAAICIVEAIVARFFPGGQQSLAMPPNIILNLSAGRGGGIGIGPGRSQAQRVRPRARAEDRRSQQN